VNKRLDLLCALCVSVSSVWIATVELARMGADGQLAGCPRHRGHRDTEDTERMSVSMKVAA
jgi:hypothetical protein